MSELREEHRGDDRRTIGCHQYQSCPGGDGRLYRVQDARDDTARIGGRDRGHGIYRQSTNVQ